MRFFRRWALAASLAASGAFPVFVTLPAAAQQGTITSPQTNCSGEPWYDARCDGAVGDGITDDTAALNTAYTTAKSHGWVLRLPPRVFKVTGTIAFILDPLVATKIISDEATLDASTYSAGPALTIYCDTPGTNHQCYYFRLQGRLFVRSASASNPTVQIGYADLSDTLVRPIIDFLEVLNTGAGGACNLNRLSAASLRVLCDSTNALGYGVSMALVTNSTLPNIHASSPNISLYMTTSGNSGNTFAAPVLDGGGTCIAIDSASNRNIFLAPNLSAGACATPISATAGSGNTLISPVYTTTLGTNLTGITIVNDIVANKFASVPSLVSGLPQITVGGAAGGVPVSQLDLAPIAAPPAPSSGWRCYSDTGDSKFKCRASSGTVRIFGNP